MVLVFWLSIRFRNTLSPVNSVQMGPVGKEVGRYFCEIPVFLAPLFSRCFNPHGPDHVSHHHFSVVSVSVVVR